MVEKNKSSDGAFSNTADVTIVRSRWLFDDKWLRLLWRPFLMETLIR